MKKSIIIFALSLFLIVACADILYLYYSGGWVEPNSLILKAELSALYLLIGIGLVLAIKTFLRINQTRNELKHCPRCGKLMRKIAINEITERTQWRCKCGLTGWDGQLK